MTPILAEAVSWPGAFMAVGIVWGVAFMVWAACKHGGTTVTTTTTEEIEEPASNYKETKVTVADRDEIKKIPTETEDERFKRRVKEVLDKDYSEFMKKVDEYVKKMHE